MRQVVFVALAFGFLFFKINFNLNGQALKTGLYISSQEEFFCVKDDTVSYSLIKSDVFNQHSLGYGSAIYTDSCVEVSHVAISDYIIKQSHIEGNEHEIRVKILYKDNSPVKFADCVIELKLKGGISTINLNTDEYGEFILYPEDFDNNSAIAAKIVVSNMDFGMYKSFLLERGKNYFLQSKVRNDASFRTVNEYESHLFFELVNDTTLFIGYDRNHINNRVLYFAGECPNAKLLLIKDSNQN